MTRFWDGRTDRRTSDPTPRPVFASATQVKMKLLLDYALHIVECTGLPILSHRSKFRLKKIN